MTVRELINILKEYPDDMEVLTSRYSSFMEMDKPEVLEILFRAKARQEWQRYERYYPSHFVNEPLPRGRVIRKFLFFEGN